MRRQLMLSGTLFLLLVGAFFAGQNPEAPWYSVVPSIIAIYLALITGRINFAFTGAIVAGFLLLFLPGSPSEPSDFFHRAVAEVFSWYSFNILAFVVWILAMVSVLNTSRALEGVVTSLSRFASNRIRAQMVTVAMGFAIFFDDYSNSIIVGSSARSLTDRFRISREKLAFLVDATAAPIAGLAIISTWVGFEAMQFQEAAKGLGITGNSNGIALLIQAIPYRFYCFLMIFFTVLVAVTGRDFGPMLKAESRAFKTGEVIAANDKPLVTSVLVSQKISTELIPRASAALIPILLLLISVLAGFWYDGGGSAVMQDNFLSLFSPSAWISVISKSENNVVVLNYCSFGASIVALLTAIFISKQRVKAGMAAYVRGAMGALLPATILMLAIVLKELCGALKTGPFLADLIGTSVPIILFPALSFVISSFTAFAIGSSWGTMGILIPVVAPAAYALEGSFGVVCLISLASVLDGAILGDHCSPISDTTILSSVASVCDHQAHVSTQFPYSVFVGIFAAGACYPLAAAGFSPLLLIPLTAVGLSLVFFALARSP